VPLSNEQTSNGTARRIISLIQIRRNNHFDFRVDVNIDHVIDCLIDWLTTSCQPGSLVLLSQRHHCTKSWVTYRWRRDWQQDNARSLPFIISLLYTLFCSCVRRPLPLRPSVQSPSLRSLVAIRRLPVNYGSDGVFCLSTCTRRYLAPPVGESRDTNCTIYTVGVSASRIHCFRRLISPLYIDVPLIKTASVRRRCSDHTSRVPAPSHLPPCRAVGRSMGPCNLGNRYRQRCVHVDSRSLYFKADESPRFVRLVGWSTDDVGGHGLVPISFSFSGASLCAHALERHVM